VTSKKPIQVLARFRLHITNQNSKIAAEEKIDL
jgi:hypothetical protein